MVLLLYAKIIAVIGHGFYIKSAFPVPKAKKNGTNDTGQNRETNVFERRTVT